jgi:serine/threonine protein kinase
VPAQGIVHRDIKSENVFRSVGGAWKLGDFGSSLRIGDDRLLNKQVVKLEGTFSFAAPEYISIWDAFTKPQLLAATTFKVGEVAAAGEAARLVSADTGSGDAACCILWLSQWLLCPSSGSSTVGRLRRSICRHVVLKPNLVATCVGSEKLLLVWVLTCPVLPVMLCPCDAVSLQLDSWSVGALAYDVLCGRAPFAVHEDIPREEEKHSILHEVRALYCGS